MGSRMDRVRRRAGAVEFLTGAGTLTQKFVKFSGQFVDGKVDGPGLLTISRPNRPEKVVSGTFFSRGDEIFKKEEGAH